MPNCWLMGLMPSLWDFKHLHQENGKILHCATIWPVFGIYLSISLLTQQGYDAAICHQSSYASYTNAFVSVTLKPNSVIDSLHFISRFSTLQQRCDFTFPCRFLFPCDTPFDSWPVIAAKILENNINTGSSSKETSMHNTMLLKFTPAWDVP